jgi:hypothetical protein
MAHPQNSPRGLFAKDRIDIGSHNLTDNSTATIFSGQIQVSATGYIGANSSGYIFTSEAALPDARSSAKWTFITNSTGENAIAVNTTGTTWKYLNVTTVIPT